MCQMTIAKPHPTHSIEVGDSGPIHPYVMGNGHIAAYLYKFDGEWRGENIRAASPRDLKHQGAPVGNMGLPVTGIEDRDGYTRDEVAAEIEAQLRERFPGVPIVGWRPTSYQIARFAA